MGCIAHDKRLRNGLAAFANWCCQSAIAPHDLADEHIHQFHDWLENRTLCAKPKARARDVPLLWTRAAETVEGWPQQQLTPISFRPPAKRLAWDDLSAQYRADVDTYMKLRAEPDRFDDHAPTKLAPKTLRLQEEHLRLAASALVGWGQPAPTSLTELVDPDAVKGVLRFYLGEGKSKSFMICLAQTLIQVAQHHVLVDGETLGRLKAIAKKLDPVPFDLTEKNKSLMRQLESDRVMAALYHLPSKLLAEASRSIDHGRFLHVAATVGFAIDIALVAPLQPQNLATLHWRRHFSEPGGPKGLLLLHIPKEETKSKKRDLIFEIPPDVAKRIRWYRREILPRLGADPNRSLFVNHDGQPKKQVTLTVQMIDAIKRHVGIHMTPHQFRHLAVVSYLEVHPDDFETVRQLLGHGWDKTTQIYAGINSRRASHAYVDHVVAQPETLRFKGLTRRRRAAA